MSNLQDIQTAVLAIPGVVGATVAEGVGGTPTVRVWTDDSRDAAELDAEVRATVARAAVPVDEAPVVVPVAEPAVPKRSGLGRGLGSLFSVAGDEPAPAHLLSVDLSDPARLELIAIEETASGITVRATDSTGEVAESRVVGGAGSVNPAIVTTVAELRQALPAPRLVSVELRDTEIATVLVVTLELIDGTPAAGAAVVKGGMPFTLGKAVWAALAAVNGRS